MANAYPGSSGCSTCLGAQQKFSGTTKIRAVVADG